MSLTTWLLGIVLALAAGAGAALVWLRIIRASRAASPLAETLARIETQMRDFEAHRLHSMGGLEANLQNLSRETVALANALRSPNSRGRWGELTLRRAAELAGMSDVCDYQEQQTAPDSLRRPDMTVKLPGGRIIAVDAKAPLSAYLDAEGAPDAASRAAALDRHAQQLSRHVNALASREYWSQFVTAPELVVMFLPGDHFLSAALERDRDLLDRALAKKVMLATPATLVSVLKGVAYGWREERLAKNAEELRRIAGEFYERVRVFAESYSDAGRQLTRAVEAYNRSVASWDARLLPSLDRMRELGIGGKDAPEPSRVDSAVRQPRAAEPGEIEIPRAHRA